MAPRPKQERQVLHEQHLADQIRQERAQREWSLDNLAQRMTDAGCPMDRSAIHRIESGKPPRRITVDEAVVFAAVFGRTLPSMLLPAAVLRTRESRKLYERHQRIVQQLDELHRTRRELEQRMVALAGEGNEQGVMDAISEARGVAGWGDYELKVWRSLAALDDKPDLGVRQLEDGSWVPIRETDEDFEEIQQAFDEIEQAHGEGGD